MWRSVSSYSQNLKWIQYSGVFQEIVFPKNMCLGTNPDDTGWGISNEYARCQFPRSKFQTRLKIGSSLSGRAWTSLLRKCNENFVGKSKGIFNIVYWSNPLWYAYWLVIYQRTCKGDWWTRQNDWYWIKTIKWDQTELHLSLLIWLPECILVCQKLLVLCSKLKKTLDEN